MVTAEPMNGAINAGPAHDHDVESLSWNSNRPPADQLILHPAPVLTAEAGIVNVKQRDPGSLVFIGAVDHPQRQLHLLTRTGG